MKDNKTHGLSKHPLYKIYHGIIKRCYNSKCKAYIRYGGVGIKMCDEWKNDFVNFYDWAIKNGWKKGMEIDKDKIPKELGTPVTLYGPETCSVLTMKENMNNQSTNRVIEHLGRKQTLSQWADEFKISYKCLWRRLNLGWSFEAALTKLMYALGQKRASHKSVKEIFSRDIAGEYVEAGKGGGV